MVEDTDLEALRIESTKTLEIETFVPAAEIDQDLPRQPLLPGARRQGGRGGLRRDPRGRWPAKKVAGIGRVVLRPARAPADAAAARARHAGDDAALSLRGAAGRRILRGHQPSASCRPAMLDIAQEIIGRMSGHFEPDSFADRYEEAVTSHAAGQAGRPELRRARDGRTEQRRRHHGGAEAQPAGGAQPTRRPRAPSKKPADGGRSRRAATARKPAARKAAR